MLSGGRSGLGGLGALVRSRCRAPREIEDREVLISECRVLLEADEAPELAHRVAHLLCGVGDPVRVQGGRGVATK